MPTAKWSSILKWLAAVAVMWLIVLWVERSWTRLEPPSPGYARALINDCSSFTIVGSDARRAVSITGIGKKLNSGNNTWVEFEWLWVSGEKATDSTIHSGGSSFLYSDQKKEWTAEGVVIPLVDVDSGQKRTFYQCNEGVP
jgi:hypothetical protein